MLNVFDICCENIIFIGDLLSSLYCLSEENFKNIYLGYALETITFIFICVQNIF